MQKIAATNEKQDFGAKKWGKRGIYSSIRSSAVSSRDTGSVAIGDRSWLPREFVFFFLSRFFGAEKGVFF
jgi:hypothetical protein